jgi:hypothetical protein
MLSNDIYICKNCKETCPYDKLARVVEYINDDAWGQATRLKTTELICPACGDTEVIPMNEMQNFYGLVRQGNDLYLERRLDDGLSFEDARDELINHHEYHAGYHKEQQQKWEGMSESAFLGGKKR